MTANVWKMHESGETAVGDPLPVIAGGELFAQVTPIWSDEDGVRVSLDWSANVDQGVRRIEDMSLQQATELVERLTDAMSCAPPR